MTSSADGVHWSAVARVPINTVSNSEDDFIPGLDVDRATSGSTARLALTYHFYPSAACSTSTCQLDVGSVTSNDGGQTWGTPTQLAGPMTLTWLASTTQGYMVGDYISTSFVGSGPATPIVVFALATAPSGSTLHEAMYAATATSGPPPTPDYSLSISPSTQTVTAGNQASYTVTVNPTGGFSSSVSLSVAGLPGDAAATFNPSSTTSTSMITITAGSTTGSYGFT